MNNAEKFKQIFGLYATELWSMPESDFLEWLNRDVETTQIDHDADIGKKVCVDTISRQAAIDAITDELMPSTPLSAVIRAKNRLKELPSVQPEIIRCKDCKYWRIDSEGERYCDRIVGVLGCDDRNGYCSDAERR